MSLKQSLESLFFLPLALRFNLVLGMNIDEKKEGFSVADENASAEEKELFKPKKVQICVKKILKATLPELTDSFVKQLGVNTIEEMRTNLKNILERKADEHVKDKEREQLADFLVKEYPFDLPVSMVEKEARFRMRQLSNDPGFHNYWQSLSEQERKKAIDTLFEQSKKAIRMFYLCRKVLLDKKINISPQELQKHPTTPLEVMLDPTQGHGLGKSTDIENAEAFSRLILEKAEDLLLSQAKERLQK
jgi:trigger factor